MNTTRLLRLSVTDQRRLVGLLPANNLLGYQIVSAAIKQAALSIGGEALNRANNDPMDSVRLGMTTGSRIVINSLRDPLQTIVWGMGVTGNAIELATQVLKDVSSRLATTRS